MGPTISKKSQLKMMESIFVLLIFFFLLTFGLVFYYNFSVWSGENKYRENVGLISIQTADRVQYLPELQCTKDGTYVEADCFDLYKLRAFEKLSEANYETYKKLFPNTKISVDLVYPSQKHFEVYDHKFNSTKSTGGMEMFYLPITLYNSTDEGHYFGFLTIGVYY